MRAHSEVAFLARNTSHGVLTTYLRDRAKVGDKIKVPTLTGKGTIKIPSGTQPGQRVRVPFGKGNRLLNGYCVEVGAGQAEFAGFLLPTE